MSVKKRPKSVHLLTALFIGFAGYGSARASQPPAQSAKAAPRVQPQVTVPSTGVPDDVQLINADTNPTLRIPANHSSLNWTLIKPRIKASFGWLEISRNTVRYTMVREARGVKEMDEAFVHSRAEITALKFEFGAAEFRDQRLRHFFVYSPPNHWDAANSPDPSVNSVSKADGVYTPFILRALQDFDGAVAEVKLKQPAVPPPVVVQPTITPEPKPPPPSPPPTVVLVAPSGASENGTVEVNEPTLTIRGVAMDNSGLPTIIINGTPAALRPKNAQAAEFWSDPITLKPGDNPMEIVAINSTQAKSYFRFAAHFTPKEAPSNPRALGKEEIISLLNGGVADSHVTDLVKERGIKFAPTPQDLNDIRSAGGSEELIAAVQRAAASAH